MKWIRPLRTLLQPRARRPGGDLEFNTFPNESFTRAFADDVVSGAMVALAKNSSRTDFSLADGDLAVLDEAERSAHALVGSYFDQMREVFHERRGNLERYGHIEWISLGEDCFSRTLATHWGLKRSRRMGEATHPFDLAVHPLPQLVKVLEHDFEGYLDPENLEYLEKPRHCRHKGYNITFNHEHGPEYAADGFALLLGAYRRRIENLRLALDREGRFVFIVHMIRGRDNLIYQLRSLVRVLKSRMRSQDFLVLCIRTSMPGRRPDDDPSKINGRRIRVIDVDYPFDGYVWYKPAHCLSPEGHAFEKDLVGRIRAVVDDWPVKPDSGSGG